jgi:hypothetical protein|nr:hypothetical protein [Kofleriaceae bacterium]
MRTILGLALVSTAAACGVTTPDADHKLPSASLTPHPQSADIAVACGDDVTWNADVTPDAHYAYTYNAAGQLVHEEGVYAAGYANDEVDFSYDAAGDFTHMQDSDGSGGWTSTIDAAYDAVNGMTDYATATTGPSYSDGWDYAMSQFAGPYQPQREIITEAGQAGFGYTLAYDADGRLITATPDDHSGATTYSYDDAAGTITWDDGSGAFHGVISYDGDGDELAETWGGTDPSAIAGSYVFAWSADSLVSEVYSSGTASAPQAVSVVETDTLDYGCAAAKRGGSARWLHAPRNAHR